MAEENEYIFCTKCGAKNDMEDKFCSACGTELKHRNAEVSGNKVRTDSAASSQTGIPFNQIILSAVILIILFITCSVCSSMETGFMQYPPPVYESKYLIYLIPVAILCGLVSNVFVKNEKCIIGIIILLLLFGWIYKPGIQGLYCTSVWLKEIYLWYIIAAGIYFVVVLLSMLLTVQLPDNVRICPKCYAYFSAEKTKCPDCGTDIKKY